MVIIKQNIANYSDFHSLSNYHILLVT